MTKKIFCFKCICIDVTFVFANLFFRSEGLQFLVIVLDPTVKLCKCQGFCLYIHCVFNVPFSMVTEFLSIHPLSKPLILEGHGRDKADFSWHWVRGGEGYTLDYQSITGLTSIDRQPFMLVFTSTDSLQLAVNLSCRTLVCGRKMENPQRRSANSTQKATTSGNSANHCTPTLHTPLHSAQIYWGTTHGHHLSYIPVWVYVCVYIFLNACHQPQNMQIHHCKSSGLVFGLGFFKLH